MWFEKEAKAARILVERRIRRSIGSRGLIAACTLFLIGTILVFVYPVVGRVTSFVDGLLSSRLTEAASYVEAVGTDQLLINFRDDPQWAGRSGSYIATIKQKLKFEKEACSITIDQEKLLKKYDTDKEHGAIIDETSNQLLRLGSLETLVIRRGVDLGTEVPALRPSQGTRDAYSVYVAFRDRLSIRTKVTDRARGSTPSDMSFSTARFHVVSRKPISEFAKALTYLDRWCGNSEEIEPRVLGK